jgi:hypothetical protein
VHCGTLRGCRKHRISRVVICESVNVPSWCVCEPPLHGALRPRARPWSDGARLDDDDDARRQHDDAPPPDASVISPFEVLPVLVIKRTGPYHASAFRRSKSVRLAISESVIRLSQTASRAALRAERAESLEAALSGNSRGQEKRAKPNQKSKNNLFPSLKVQVNCQRQGCSCHTQGTVGSHMIGPDHFVASSRGLALVSV